MPDAPAGTAARPATDFKARLNRDIAFTIIDEQIRSGVEPSHLTGRGLAKQYGFGSPQTWVTHLKDWRQQHGLAPAEETLKEAEVEAEAPPAPERPEGGQETYGVISRAEFVQAQEMWNRLLAEREQVTSERVKVARMEGEREGRAQGLQEGRDLAQAREQMLDERVRRERLEGERAGEQRATQEVAVRLRGERRLVVGLAFGVGLPLGLIVGGVLTWMLQRTPPAAAQQTAPPLIAPPPAAPAPTATPPVQDPPAPSTGEAKSSPEGGATSDAPTSAPATSAPGP